MVAFHSVSVSSPLALAEAFVLLQLLLVLFAANVVLGFLLPAAVVVAVAFLFEYCLDTSLNTVR